MASTLAALLPAPVNEVYAVALDDRPVEKPQAQQQQQALVSTAVKRPPYGSRKGWKPSKQEDYGDGGAYPECHIAQFPLMLGKKQVSSGNTLALQVDSDGKVRYDAIAMQGHREGRNVQSSFKDLIPLAHRTDVENSEMERPSDDVVNDTAEKTRLALEKLVSGKIKAAQPKNVALKGGKESFVRYTPGGPGADGTKQRIIKMVEVVEDPLEPPRFKHKKVPRGPPTPPPPVLRSPPRKPTAQDQKDWMIPPCVSNWKNNKGYTIPLDKRLAADGRGLQDVYINDKFATFSESLYIADRHAREEVRQRAAMQQRIAEKEKEAKEESLRLLALRAREERTGPSAGGSRMVENPSASMALGGYGSDSDEEGSDAEGSRAPVARAAAADTESEAGSDEDVDSEAAKERDRMRAERRKEREREMRMSNMGTEQRARVLARAQNRDISEKIALGLAKPTLSKESMMDSRLFNQEQYSGSMGDEDSYHLYDKPLFAGSSAAAAIYKPMTSSAGMDDDAGAEESIKGAMRNDRFGLGVAGRGFEGAAEQERREGPVQFEKDAAVADPFGVSAFLESAKTGAKRGLDVPDSEARKRQRE